MDKIDRDLIHQHITKLVETTDYIVLMQKCRQKSLLNPIMMEVIENSSRDPKERHYNLFQKITKRGPNAYDILLDILKECDYMEAYKLLKPSSYEGSMLSLRQKPKVPVIENSTVATNNRMNRRAENFQKLSQMRISEDSADILLKPYTEAVNPPIEPINVKNATEFGKRSQLPVYSMRSKNRGVFFLVNIINFVKKSPRAGAEVDRDNLITLFRGLGFTIFYYEDLTQKQFSILLDELLESDYLRSTDSFVLGILTHGDFHDGVATIEFHDSSYTNLETVISKFQNHNCVQLINKPKIFLFPFCRGNISDRGVHIQRRGKIEHDHIADVSMTINFPTYSDILVLYATVPGFQTHRDTIYGSWYISSMCKIWSQYAHNHDVEDLVKLVGFDCSQYRCENSGALQTDSRVSKGFNRLMFLNPGLSE